MKILRYLGVLLLNLFFTVRWSIPAWFLLIMHFVRGWRILWFWIALFAWIAGVMIYMHVIGWLTFMGNGEEKENPNVNPYSQNKDRN